MIVPPQPTKRRKRSLKRVPLKSKKAAAAANKAVPKPRSARKQSKRWKVGDAQEHFSAANALLKNMIQSPEIRKSFDPRMRTNSRMVYTKGVTLWMLILQRLGNGLSLEDTVSHILTHDRDLLPENKRVREGTLSENSSGYHKAKKDLSIESIHEVELDNNSFLYLVTTLEIDAPSAAELYSHRYDVEFDIRDLKVTMDTENILAKSVEMVIKELVTSVVAYNLIAQFRRQAASLVRVQPRRLSFKGVWLSFRDHLLLKEPENLSEWQDLYAEALISAGNRKHPNRKKPRSYPRRAHPRRQKSTKFMSAKNKKEEKQNGESPPTTESK